MAGKLGKKEQNITNNLIVKVTRSMTLLRSQKTTMDSLDASNHITQVLKAPYKQIANHSLSLSDLWILLATALVFTMHLGFATLKAVLSRLENVSSNLFEKYKCRWGAWRPVLTPPIQHFRH